MGALDPSSTPEHAGSAGPVSVGYRRYVLGLLVTVYVFNFIDRQILSILVESIRRDIGLSDTQIGFLTGIAFAAVYTTAGIPIARLADRSVRRSIIAAGLAAWSGMTALTGLARSFPELALARFGVGLGEAACSPPAHSLLSDYFPPERRGTALSIYSLGIPIGVMIGFIAGGWINEIFGWRQAFFAVGVPGLILAVVVRLTLREPQRGAADRPTGAPPSPVPAESLGEVLRFMGRLRAFRHMALAAALHAFYGYGAGAFLAPFFIRIHGMSSGEVGTWLGLISGLVGGVGTFLGGTLGDRLSARHGDARWYMWVPALSTLGSVPFAFFLYLWPEPRTALLLFMPAALAGPMYLGSTFAMTQGLARPHMRAMAAAILMFVINMIGLGLGPQVVGLASDLLAPRLGVASLRWALLGVVVPLSLWSALHYLLAARTLRQELAASAAANEAGAGGVAPGGPS